MARDFPDNYDTSPDEMFAAAMSMIEHCTVHLEECRMITRNLATTMGTSRPDIAERLDATGQRIEDKLRLMTA